MNEEQRKAAEAGLLELLSMDMYLIAFGGGSMWGDEEYKRLRYYDYLAERYPFAGGDPEQNGYHPCAHDPRGRTDFPFNITVCPPCWTDYTAWLDVKLQEAEAALSARLEIDAPPSPAFLEGVQWGAIKNREPHPDTRLHGREEARPE